MFMWYVLFAKPYSWRGVWDELLSAEIYPWQVVGMGYWGEVGYPCIGIKYIPLLWSFFPYSVVILSLVSCKVSLLRVAVNPAFT